MTTLLPLTAAQQGIAAAQRLWPHKGVFILAESVTLTGSIDPHRWAAAVRSMIADTEAQRILLCDNGEEIMQRIVSPDRVPVTVLDLTGEDDPAAVAETIMADDRGRPCDPYTEITTAHLILTLAPGTVVWHHRAHHVALDGYGFAQCARRVADHYRASIEGTAAAVLSSGLADVVAADRAFEASDACAEAAAYWHRTSIARSAPTLTATPAAPSGTTIRAHRTLAHWAPSAVVRYGAVESVLAAVAIYLARRTGEAEVVLGVPMMNRLGSVAATVPAMVLNALALPVRVDPARTVAELATRIGTDLRRSRKHARYRHERLRAELGLLGGGRALLGPVVNLMPFDYDFGLPGIEVRAENRGAGPVEDLSINVYLRHGTAELAIDANPRCYTVTELEGHATALVRAIETAATEPHCHIDDFAMNYRLVQRPDPIPAPHPLARWIAHVRADPAASALAGGDLCDCATGISPLATQSCSAPTARGARRCSCPELTRGELHGLAAVRAADLRAAGVRAGAVVAILPTGAATDIVTILAAHLAGAAHAVLDRALSPRQLRGILHDLGPSVLVHDADTAEIARAIAGSTACVPVPCRVVGGSTGPIAALPAVDAGYAVFTSGTSGRPKAVRVGGGALAAFVEDALVRYGWTSDDRVLQYGPLHADTSIEEIFVTLAAGGCLVRGGNARTPSELAVVSDRHALTVLDLPTAVWHELAGVVTAGTLGLPGSLRQIVVGGEEVSAVLVDRWRSAHLPALHNSYGPSEATVVCASIELTDVDVSSIPLGALFPRVGAVLAVDSLEPVGEAADPTAAVGILHLFGPTLADGYCPSEAGAGFREITVGAEVLRVFGTGDRVRLRADDILEYEGRVDGIVKIGGARIAVATIEDRLRRCPGVGDALVTRHSDYALAALVIRTGEQSTTWLDGLRGALAEQLPPAWVPAVITAVDTLPRTRNLKADRRVITRIEPGDNGTRIVCGVLADVLGLVDLDPVADFFAAGLTSMQIIAVATRLTAETGIPVTVDDILSAPSAEALAARLSLGRARHAVGDIADVGPDLTREIAALRTALAAATSAGARSRTILLTGATGFLGAYLLTELLDRTDRGIIAVVRADTVPKARSRLRAGCAGIGAAALFDDACAAGRVRILLGDCATDDFTGHAELVSGIGHIVHGAARISAIRPYSSLRAVNVVAAQRLLLLARVHGAGLTLVSTATAAGPGGEPADPADLPTGYAQTKCVAEHLLDTATREFDVRTSVVRLGRVLPAPGDERGASADFLHDLAAAAAALGVLPETEVAEPMVRADHLASVIIGTLEHRPTGLMRVLDPYGPGPVPVARVLEAAAPAGCPTAPLEQWRALVADHPGLAADRRAAVVRWCDIQLAGFSRDWTSRHSFPVPGTTPVAAARLLRLHESWR